MEFNDGTNEKKNFLILKIKKQMCILNYFFYKPFIFVSKIKFILVNLFEKNPKMT